MILINEYELKQRLLSYQYDIAKLKIIEERIKYICNNNGMKGMTYDNPKLSESFKFNSNTEETAIRNIDAYEKLIREHGKQELKVLEIKYALEGLTKKESKLIEMKYIDKLNFDEIGDKLGYSKIYIKKTHRNIINKLIDILN